MHSSSAKKNKKKEKTNEEKYCSSNGTSAFDCFHIGTPDIYQNN